MTPERWRRASRRTSHSVLSDLGPTNKPTPSLRNQLHLWPPGNGNGWTWNMGFRELDQDLSSAKCSVSKSRSLCFPFLAFTHFTSSNPKIDHTGIAMAWLIAKRNWVGCFKFTLKLSCWQCGAIEFSFVRGGPKNFTLAGFFCLSGIFTLSNMSYLCRASYIDIFFYLIC